jgi:hypothetical protein
MKLSFLQSLVLAGLLGCCSGTRADEMPAALTLLPVRAPVLVKQVSGNVQYTYDSTGWRTLPQGKVLKPGATIRAAGGSNAVLRMADSTSFFKVSATTAVHITSEAPIEELGTGAFVAQKSEPRTVAALD